MNREERIRSVVNEVIHKRHLGIEAPDAEVLRQYPEYLPELREDLAALAKWERARETVDLERRFLSEPGAIGAQGLPGRRMGNAVAVTVLVAMAFIGVRFFTSRDVPSPTSGFDLVKSMRLDDGLARLAQDTAEYKRVSNKVDVPVETWSHVLADIPFELLEVARDADNVRRAEALDWIEQSEEALDQIAAEVSVHSYLVGGPEQSQLQLSHEWYAMRSRYAEVTHAFVARAHIRYEAGLVAESIDDARTAHLLATDFGDGVSILAKQFSLRLHESVYAFIQSAWVEELNAGRPAEEFVKLVPTLARLDSWHNGLDYWAAWYEDLAAGAEGSRGILDVKVLAQSTGRSFDSAQYTQPVSVDAAYRCVDRYIRNAKLWEHLTYHELKAAIRDAEFEISREIDRNPFAFLMPSFGNAYLELKTTRAIARAMRVVGLVVAYRNREGRWPDRLSSVITPASLADFRDPITGEAFVYDVYDGIPRIRATAAGEQQLYFPRL